MRVELERAVVFSFATCLNSDAERGGRDFTTQQFLPPRLASGANLGGLA